MNPRRQHPRINVASTRLWLWLWYPWPNGCLQQIAANRFSTPQDVIAILLQGFVRSSLFRFFTTHHFEQSRTLSGMDSTSTVEAAHSQPRTLEGLRRSSLT
jgi:hypothetical protein